MMPVPSSYNDITQSKDYRDHVGWAWYDRQFYVPTGWQTGRRIFLRFGSAHYTSIVVRYLDAFVLWIQLRKLY